MDIEKQAPVADPALIAYLEELLRAAKGGELLTLIASATILSIDPKQKKLVMTPKAFAGAGGIITTMQSKDLPLVLQRTIEGMSSATVSFGQFMDTTEKAAKKREEETVPRIFRP